MSKRIGIVTGGGDCSGLNAVIRAVSKAAAKRDSRETFHLLTALFHSITVT
jgi:6-phosphofructokinase